MPHTKLIAAMLSAALCLTFTACGESEKVKAEKAAADKARGEEIAKIGVEAVVYGLPIVIAELTKRVQTNVVAPQPDSHAPVNQIGNMVKYPPASNHDVVRLNVDTLYSFAFLDLTAEPIILSVPDTNGRYYLMPLISAWTNVFASPGKRTTGTKAGNFVITGPGWTGDVPKDMTEYKAPTNLVMVAGRTQANGPADYTAVNAIQNKYKVTPLSAWGKPYTPPAGVVDPAEDMSPPATQVAKMSSADFFKTLAALLKSNPPAAADAPMLVQLARIGIVPGQDFDIAKLDPAVAKALEP